MSSNQAVPGDIVGVGVNLPAQYDLEGFRKQYNISKEYIVYIGRIDPNKGCREMLDNILHYYARHSSLTVNLVLIGRDVMPEPRHKNIIHLGYVSEEDKFAALEGAQFMIMPSRYESLSMVILEAWLVSKAVLVNGQCEVLKGQCLRSNGGLYYHNYREFERCMDYMLHNPAPLEELGRRGNAYAVANYHWDIIEKKYLELINRSFNQKGGS